MGGCGMGVGNQPVSYSENLLRKADSVLRCWVHICVCTFMWRQTSPPHTPHHSILSFSSALCSPLPLQYLTLAHSFLCWLWGRALSAFLPGSWLCSSISLCASCLFSSPPTAYVSPLWGSSASLLPWLLLLLEQWSCLTLRCYVALPRFSSMLFASHSALVDNHHWVCLGSDRGRERREEKRQTPHLTAALSCLSFPLLFWAEEESREYLDRRELFSLVFPTTVHSWDRVQGSREEGGTENRTSDSAFSCTAQCPTLLQRHISQTHNLSLAEKTTDWQHSVHSEGRTDRRFSVMASVDSTGSSVSGRMRSGDLLHAGLAVVLLLGELYSWLYL